MEDRKSTADKPRPSIDTFAPPRSRLTLRTFLGLAFASLGIIYGDIGTSPLYVIASMWPDGEATPEDIIGGVSLVVWTIVIMVCIKYIVFVLKADNHGEGGTFALASQLLGDKVLSRRSKVAVSVISIIAGSMVIGDGALTPAISVLSAMEGLEPGAHSGGGANHGHYFGDFIRMPEVRHSQRHDSLDRSTVFVPRPARCSLAFIFAPITFVWFFSLFSLGMYWIVQEPSCLRSLNPWEGLQYLSAQGTRGFLQLGAVFLAVTGVEALYADLGHFHAGPIRTSWLAIVLPSLLVNYMGQGALVITDVNNLASPFYLMAPGPLLWPMLILATMATVIASQAMITGCFSLVSQAIALDCFPPLPITHTSKQHIGQIYVGPVNYFLMVLSSLLVIGFQRSTLLGQAYGVTVSTVMVMTTLAFMVVMRYAWRLALWKVLPFGIILAIDVLFWTSNLTKIPDGGWVSILIAAFFSIVMLCWYLGQRGLKSWYAQQYGGREELLLMRRFLVRKPSAQNSQQEPTAQQCAMYTWQQLADEEQQKARRPSFIVGPLSPAPPRGEVPEARATKHSLRDAVELPGSDSDSKRKDIEAALSSTGGGGSEQGSAPKEDDRTTSDSGSSVDLEADKLVAAHMPGTGVMLSPKKLGLPTVLHTMVRRLRAAPQLSIFLTVETVKVPTVAPQHRIVVCSYGDRIYRVVVRRGYADRRCDALAVLREAEDFGLPKLNVATLTFFINSENVHPHLDSWKDPRSWLHFIPMRVYEFLKSVFHGNMQSIRLPEGMTVELAARVVL